MSFWKDAIRTVAPVLGAAMGGGPLGAAAMRAVTNKLLGTEEIATTPEQKRTLMDKLELAVATDPDALLKLKECEYEFKKTLKELGIKEEEVHAGDRSNARKMAVDTTLLPQMVLSVVYVCAFAAILWAVFTGKAELVGTQKDIAMLLIGILSAGLVQIMNFFFGSSAGSKTKDKPQL